MKGLNNYILEKLSIDKNIKVNKIDDVEKYVFAYPDTQNAVDELISKLSEKELTDNILYTNQQSNNFGFVIKISLIDELDKKYIEDIEFYEIPDRYKRIQDFINWFEDRGAAFRDLDPYKI